MGLCQSRVGGSAWAWGSVRGWRAQPGLGLRSQPGSGDSAVAGIGPRVRQIGQETGRGAERQWPSTERRERERETELSPQSGLGRQSVSAGVTHGLGVGTVGAEGQGEGRRQDAQLAHHLLHAPERPLLVRVGKLDHQAGGGTLQGRRRAGRERRREVARTLGSRNHDASGPWPRAV